MLQPDCYVSVLICLMNNMQQWQTTQQPAAGESKIVRSFYFLRNLKVLCSPAPSPPPAPSPAKKIKNVMRRRAEEWRTYIYRQRRTLVFFGCLSGNYCTYWRYVHKFEVRVHIFSYPRSARNKKRTWSLRGRLDKQINYQVRTYITCLRLQFIIKFRPLVLLQKKFQV